MVDQVTNRSRCFGFVTFEHGNDGAQKAIDQQPLNVQGRKVEVKLVRFIFECRASCSLSGKYRERKRKRKRKRKLILI
ncbi:MAG: RNA recognition motif-containing protein [Bacillariaceae sp.]|jgi:RNA recognition motif-containing protein